MIRVFRTGAHAHRTPLSYSALAPLFSDEITHTQRPDQADIYVFAHSLDIENAPLELVEDWRQRQRPIVLLSEEPFWDTIWGRQPLARRRTIDSRYGLLPVYQLNHCTSSIFRFTKIPYYLLTNHRFANAYAARLKRNCELSEQDWQNAFASRPTRLSFMFERRPEPFHSISWPEAGLAGLCNWRTKVAEHCRAGPIKCFGRSWNGASPDRRQLYDWHLDKLALLDNHQQTLMAFENTHHPEYITEKIFDAFACGALPAYWAAPEHRLHEFGLPEGSWLNLHGLTPTEAATRLDGLSWDSPSWVRDFCAAYTAAQHRLAALLCNPSHWLHERQRLKTTLLAELTEILDGN